MKWFKESWDKIIDVVDDFAAQLGLQPKPVPVRVKKNNTRKRNENYKKPIT